MNDVSPGVVDQTPGAPRPALSPDAPTPEPRKPLVVCVDDEAPILQSLTRLLRAEPYDFLTTTDPEEGLDWARTREVALFVADYRMPHMSGTTLLQLVKSSSPATARMLLTGYPGETIIIAAREAGLLHLVGKPWDDAALKSKIRRLLQPSDDDRQAGGSADPV